jgi:hypothetical protein
MKTKKKTNKKYNFSHLKSKNEDIANKGVIPEVSSKKAKETELADKELSYFYFDLRRVAIIGSVFVALMISLYLLVNKTDYLDPVLKLFNL